MPERTASWRWVAIACGIALLILYCYGLDRMGIYGPDEPRYAAIGLEMSRSGDLVTPRLWGAPWFEKPALLYWMIAAGFRAGLSPELAARLPVAFCSLAFLATFCWLLRREFGTTAAAYATAILATSGGWLALSGIGVTDIPMSAAFALAILCTIPWIRTGDRRWLTAAAAALAIATLAKAAAPLALAIPVAWFGRKRWRDFFRPAPVLTFLAIALPWYILCTLRNGMPFLYMLFWVHHVERFVSASIQHVQPFWFYIPLLPAAFFPWTPVCALLFRRDLYADARVRMLLGTALWGFVFLSATTNKLPTYLLPLVPLIAAVMGLALERAKFAGRITVILSALLCGALPVLVAKLPSLMSGNRHAAAPEIPVALAVLILLTAGALCFLRDRTTSVALVGLLAGIGYLWLKAETLPFVDEAATARPLWLRIAARREDTCVQDLPRGWRYSLNYYSATPLPDCSAAPSSRTRLAFRDHAPVIVVGTPK